MHKNKKINLKNSIYMLIIALFVATAIISIVSYVMIDFSHRQKIHGNSQALPSNPVVQLLPQNAWLKQSQLKIINSVINASYTEKLGALSDNYGNTYVNFKLLKNKYNLSISISKSEDVIYFIFLGKNAYLRLGSNQILFDGKVQKFESSPLEYDGTIYIPAIMVEFFEKQMGSYFSWAAFDGKVYLNTILVKNKVDFFKVSNDFTSITIKDVFDDKLVAVFKTVKENITKIVPVYFGKRYLLFVSTSQNNILLELRDHIIRKVQIFPKNSALSKDGKSIFWQDFDNLQAYNIGEERLFKLNKKDFENGFFERIFGVGEFKVISVSYKNSNEYSVDFIDSNDNEACLKKSKDGTKLFSDIISSPNRCLFIMKTDNYYEVFNKVSGVRKAIFYSTVVPVWISNNFVCFKYDGVLREIDLLSGLQKEVNNQNQILDKVFKNGWKVRVTNDYLVVIQQSTSGTIIEVAKNHILPKDSQTFNLQVDTNSTDFSVSQRGNKSIIVTDSKISWLINVNSNQVFFTK